jgi:hypothetical protein
LSENLTGRGEVKKLDPATLRTGRHRIRTVHWKSKLDPITYFHNYDRCSGTRKYYITIKELAHSYTIIFVSAGAFGTGIGQFLRYLGS